MLLLKTIHVATVGTNFILFVTRAYSVFTRNTWHKKPLLRVLPHINDSLLLLSAVGLAIALHQYPFVQLWLTAKIVLLVVYILLGMAFMKYSRTPWQMRLLFVLSILCFWTMVFIAYHHDVSVMG